MIVEKILSYLRSAGKNVDDAVVDWASAQMKRALVRQFMRDQQQRPGVVYATLVAQGCARKAAYRYFGVPPDEELQPRTIVNFFIGDVTEVAVLALSKVAGCDLCTPAELLHDGERMTAERDGVAMGCWPDAVVAAGDTWMNVEVKKLSEAQFDRLDRTGQVEDLWGYRTQCMLEVLAWRQRGLPVVGTVFLALRGLTGHIGEWVVQYDETLVDRAFERARAVLQATPEVLPTRAYAAERTKQGRWKLPTPCAYCAWKRTCWKTVTVAVDSRGAPTFYVEEVQG